MSAFLDNMEEEEIEYYVTLGKIHNMLDLFKRCLMDCDKIEDNNIKKVVITIDYTGDDREVEFKEIKRRN